MSIKKMFEDKIGDLVVDPRAVRTVQRVPATAPGSLMAFSGELEQARQESADLRERLEKFDGSSVTRHLDASKIRESPYANRHESAYSTKEFADLKDEIASARGNVQAIRVRPVKGEGDVLYEVVFGHRRRRACLELGLPVLAMIEEATDTDLFEKMTRENLNRADLSPFELGSSYRRALDRGLYPTQAMLAQALNKSAMHVSQALLVASLPGEVVGAFPNPISIQYRWAAEIDAALKKDKVAVLTRAGSLAESSRNRSAIDAFHGLVGKQGSHALDVRVRGEKVAKIVQSSGSVSVRFVKGVVPGARVSELNKLLADFVGSFTDRSAGASKEK